MKNLVTLVGSTRPLPKTIPLRAGRLSLIYESGFLRYISNANIEVVRMINHYVRDANWNTMPMRIVSEQVERNASAFSISYSAIVDQADIQLEWSCHITGREDESVTFEISGEALSDFKRNRLGFTVLHPATPLLGKPCLITHGDNSTESLHFPELISPHQPFVDIKAMKWSPGNDIDAVLEFEGDLFEMEDQRNWLDASHKTYCTPLTKPFPHQVRKGDRVHQIVQLKVSGNLRDIDLEEDQALTFLVDKTHSTRLPEIGIPMANLHHSELIIEKIKELQVDFVRITLRSDEVKIGDKVRMALAFGLPLEIVLFFDRDTQTTFFKDIAPYEASIRQFIVLPLGKASADSKLLDQVVPILRTQFPNSRIGSGTDAFFTELNRERTPTTLIHFLSFSVNPQSHASDIRTMTENLAAHKDVVESCRSFADGRDIHVGPVSLKMRWNPSATSSVKVPEEGVGLPTDVDPRQLSLYGAGWTLGSIKHLAENNVSAATYFETCGWRGLMSNDDQPWPEEFNQLKGSVYPVYSMLRELMRHKKALVLRLESSNPLKMDGIAFLKESSRVTVMLANYTEEAIVGLVPENLQDPTCEVMFSDMMDISNESPAKTLTEIGDDKSFKIPPFGIVILKASFGK